MRILKKNLEEWLKDYYLTLGTCLADRMEFSKFLSWEKKVNRTHKWIRNLFGDEESIEFNIEIGKSANEEVLQWHEVRPLATKLSYLVPQYFQKYGLYNDYLVYPKIPVGDHANMTWGKHISTFLTRAKVDAATKKQALEIMADIGKLHARNKLTKDKYVITLSTEPAAFVSLGHVGADEGSCFKIGGMNEIHKFIIGQNPNTFIGYVSDQSYEGSDFKNINPKMRFWGFIEDNKTVHICNCYPKNPKKEGNIFQAIKIAVDKIIEGESTQRHDKFRVSGAYFNRGSGVSYYPNGIVPATKKTVLEFQDNGLSLYRKCPRCDLYPRSEAIKFESVDDMMYCKGCSEPYPKCQFTGKRSKNLVSAYVKEKLLSISTMIAEDEFIITQNDGCFHHYDDVIKSRNGNFYTKKYAESALTLCKNCGFYSESECSCQKVK